MMCGKHKEVFEVILKEVASVRATLEKKGKVNHDFDSEVINFPIKDVKNAQKVLADLCEYIHENTETKRGKHENTNHN